MEEARALGEELGLEQTFTTSLPRGSKKENAKETPAEKERLDALISKGQEAYVLLLISDSDSDRCLTDDRNEQMERIASSFRRRELARAFDTNLSAQSTVSPAAELAGSASRLSPGLLCLSLR